MTNISKQTRITLCSVEKMLKLLRKNNFISAIKAGPPNDRGCLYEVRCRKRHATHRFPAYIAMFILEASKRKLQEFSYDLLRTLRPTSYSLCSLDTG